MHMTVSADPVDCKQRIRLNRAPNTTDEMAMTDALKANGYTWNGYSDTGTNRDEGADKLWAYR